MQSVPGVRESAREGMGGGMGRGRKITNSEGTNILVTY